MSGPTARRWVENAIGRGNRRKTDHATRLKIVERYQAGETLIEIGRDLGLSDKTVGVVLHDAGVERRPAARRPKEPQ